MSQTTIQTYREIGLVYLDSNGCNTNFLPVAHTRDSPIPSEQGYLSLLSLLYHISILQSPPKEVSEKSWRAMREFNDRLSDEKKYFSILIPTDEGMTVALKLTQVKNQGQRNV